jgi:mersacidin/lichenicidin family type 2 lantibiotic
MDKEQIIRAWKDEEYRSALGESESSQLPENPAGIVDLSDESLGAVGGQTVGWVCTAISVITAVTSALSCAPSCEATIGGTCRNFTSGCCGPIQKLPV